MQNTKFRNCNYWHYIILTMLLIGLATSCEKDEPQPPAGCILKTITFSPPGVIYTAHYDTKKQITEISNFSEDGWTGTTYEYDVNGNLAFASNWTFTYDNNNRLVQIGRPVAEFTEDYTYNAYGQLASDTSKSFSSGEPSITRICTYTYPNISTHNFSAITYSYGATETFEYDNKPNPFKSYWLHLGAANLLYRDEQGLTDNNITKSVYTEGTTTVTTTYLYEYNELGYPLRIEIGTQITTSSESYPLTTPPYTITYTCR